MNSHLINRQKLCFVADIYIFFDVMYQDKKDYCIILIHFK